VLRRTVVSVTTNTAQPAQASGTLTLGGELTVNRLGFGAMRLTGKGVWGPPVDRDECVRVLRRAVELGVNFIDTADSYGPYISEDIIREALHPYEGLVIATKAGLLRTGPDVWIPLGNPSYLRQECEMSLRRLRVEAIDLFQLHRIDANFSLADQVGELVKLQQEGKIRQIGLSEINVDQLKAAQQITPIVSVQNMYNLAARTAEPLLDAAAAQGIAFIPWFPLAAGPSPRHAVPVGAGLAAEAVPGDAADSGHVQRGPPGAERRRSGDNPHRRRIRDTGCRRRPTKQLAGLRFIAGGPPNTVLWWPANMRDTRAADLIRPNRRSRAGPTTAGSSRPFVRCRTTPGRSTRPTV